MDLCDFQLREAGPSSTANNRTRTTFSDFCIFQVDYHGLAQPLSSVSAGLHIPPGYTVIFTSTGKYVPFSAFISVCLA